MKVFKMMNRIKCFLQGHTFAFKRNVYGDEIMALDARSIFKCTRCGKFKYEHSLYPDYLRKQK